MDASGLKELFAPFALVSVKRMFSGYGVYADGICFALNLRGDVFLKADEQTEARFAAAGSKPFVYDGHRGKVTVTSYWRLAPSAYDDPDELKSWCGLAMEAARRAAAVKEARSARRLAKAEKGRAKPAKGGAKASARKGVAKGRAGRPER
jgi:DNA transformation protein and related proteins